MMKILCLIMAIGIVYAQPEKTTDQKSSDEPMTAEKLKQEQEEQIPAGPYKDGAFQFFDKEEKDKKEAKDEAEQSN